ncbi:hypothetical protein SAMN04488554_0139 [Ruania alba]|uniref:Uncharacterized protein n=1 Tax=Ruania alba TaxID=648782 RepID=A0A1H5BN55_9MICO|nr:hypothetical protein SAMN04488554_0139 [Ruania alba]
MTRNALDVLDWMVSIAYQFSFVGSAVESHGDSAHNAPDFESTWRGIR